MALLDPTAISDPDDYTPEDYRDKGLVIRRFKKDIKRPGHGRLQGAAHDQLTRSRPTRAEEAAYRALLDIRFTQAGQAPRRQAAGAATRRHAKGALLQPVCRTGVHPDAIRPAHARTSTTADERQEVADLTGVRGGAGAYRRQQFQQVPAAAGVPAGSAEFGWALHDRRTAWWCSPSAWRPCAGCSGQLTARPAPARPRRSPSCTASSPTPSSRSIVERFGRLEDPIARAALLGRRIRGTESPLLLPSADPF